MPSTFIFNPLVWSSEIVPIGYLILYPKSAPYSCGLKYLRNALYQETTTDENGDEIFSGAQSFSFNDLDLDRKGLTSKKVTLSFMSKKDVDKTVKESGIENQTVLSRWNYALTQSDATSG